MYWTCFRNNASIDGKEKKSEIVSACLPYLSNEDVVDIASAFDFGYFYHATTTEPVVGKRWRGTEGSDGNLQEYMVHPGAVAKLLAEIKSDATTIKAAILHDTIEDTILPEALIRHLFGKEVLKTVKTVTKITGIQAKSEKKRKKLEKNLTLTKLFRAFEEDPRSILIKIADRLHNMETIYGLPEKNRNRFAQETISTFVPMARIVNMDDWADKMYNLAAFQLWPDEAEKATKIIEERYKDEYLDFVKRELEGDGIEVLIGKPHIYEFIRQIDDKIEVVDPDVRTIKIIAANDNAHKMPGFSRDIITRTRRSGLLKLMF